jgi:hypothetical protein
MWKTTCEVTRYRDRT